MKELKMTFDRMSRISDSDLIRIQAGCWLIKNKQCSFLFSPHFTCSVPMNFTLQWPSNVVKPSVQALLPFERLPPTSPEQFPSASALYPE